MTTTDHTAEAERTIQQVLNTSETSEDAGSIVSMLAAQAHATLALAEQQRIANLIALAALQIASGADGGIDSIVGDGSAFRALDPDGPATPLRPAIARALGIEEAE